MFEKVRAIMAEQFAVEEDTISRETTIAEDLGADSLDTVDLLMKIEDEFGLEIPDEDVSSGQFKTVGDLTDYLEKRLA